MRRPSTRPLTMLAPTAIAFAIVAAACGSSAKEEPQVRQFFRASGLRDSQTLANFAAASFDPREAGVVQSFQVTSVSDERKSPLELKALAKAHEDARAAQDEFSKRKIEYQKANEDAIDRVLKAEKSSGKITGKDAVVQTEWMKWRADTADYAKKVSEARTKLQNQRPIAELSVENPRAPVDITTVDGDMVAKDVTVNAKVKLPADKGGQVVDKTLVITMQRVVGKTADGKDVAGKWIITKVQDQAGATKTS
jgi:hypothetical protein